MTNWIIPTDQFLENTKLYWYNRSQEYKDVETNKAVLNEWFQSTKRNTITGWDTMGCVDFTMGCTHFIESFIIGQNGLDNFQTLPDELCKKRRAEGIER